MSDFLNPLGGRFIGLTGPVAPSSISGTIPDPPRGFRLLDPGTIIKGVVIGRENDGLVAIATDKGTVRVASNVALPPGTHVTLEVRPAGDRLQVLILASDAARAPPSPGGPTASPPGAASGGPPPPSVPGNAPGNIVPGHSPPGPAPAAAPAGSTTPASTSTTGQTGTPGPGTPSPGTPPSGTQSAATQTLPLIQVVGATLRAIVLHPQAPQPTLAPTGQAGPSTTGTAPMIPGFVPVNATTQQPASPLPATNPLPAASVPGGWTAPAVAPANITPQANVTPQANAQELVPAPASSSAGSAPLPSTTPTPAASVLSSDARQRILSLFVQPTDSNTVPLAGRAPPFQVQPPQAQPLQAQPGQPQVSLPQPQVSLPLGATLQLRVLAVQIGAQHAIEIDPAAQIRAGGKDSHIVFGRVIAVTPAGHPVIHTPAGDILLQQRSSLPVGAQLALAMDQVELAPPVGGAVAPLPVQTPQQALLSLARGWPTLADLIAILQGGAPNATGKGGGPLDPALARQILAQLPQVGPRLGAGLIGAMAAFRSGDLGRLLGPLLARGLGPEREEMVRRLRTEFTQLSALAQERPEGEWRALFLPLLDEHQRVQRINLFYRQHRKGDGEGLDPEAGTRFVVEAEFSRLGPFQLDGLMRQQRFDLMIRSRQRLDERMRRDIEAIYEEARGITGFAGLIAFQTVHEFPVSPLEEMKRDSAHLTA